MKYNKGFAPIIIALIIAGVLVLGGGAYYLNKNSNDIKKEVNVEENSNISKQNHNRSVSQEINLPAKNTKVEQKSDKSIKTNSPIQISNNTQKDTTIIDCGTTDLAGFTSESGYEKNKVTKCIGDSILNGCKNAKALINPTNGGNKTELQIINNNGVCFFKATSDKGYNQCPVSSAELLSYDYDKSADIFVKPDIKDSAEYATSIYYYATQSFMIEHIFSKEQDINKNLSEKEIENQIINKFKNEGCTGDLSLVNWKEYQ